MGSVPRAHFADCAITNEDPVPFWNALQKYLEII
jgi:hypothetical protein